MEASRDQVFSKAKPSRPPSFTESPKEDKENGKEKQDWCSKDDSGTESDIEGSSEEDSDEESEEEEETEGTTPTVESVAPRPKVAVNSKPPKLTGNSLREPEEESESEDESGSETEESFEGEEEDEEEEKPAVKPDSRNSATSSLTTISTKRAQNTPLSVPNQGMGAPSRLKSPFIDNDKKGAGPSSPISKTEHFKTPRSPAKEDSTLRSWSYPTRTTAATTSNTTSTTTANITGRTNTTSSDDSQSRRPRYKRPFTSYVSGGDRPDNEDEDKKSNDVSYSKGGGDDERKVRLT